jgi:hypothetical protein
VLDGVVVGVAVGVAV